MPASDPVSGVRGDAPLSEQHHLPSEPSTSSQDGFARLGLPKNPPNLGSALQPATLEVSARLVAVSEQNA